MGYRRITDRDGETWDIKDQSDSVWRFEPVGGNPAGPVVAFWLLLRRVVLDKGYTQM